MLEETNLVLQSINNDLQPPPTIVSDSNEFLVQLRTCLIEQLNVKCMFMTGSMTLGTAVRGYSKIDCFALLPGSESNSCSIKTLEAFEDALKARFRYGEISKSAFSVTVSFEECFGARFQITPVKFLTSRRGYSLYEIPDRHGGWMRSSPTGLNEYIKQQSINAPIQTKQLIRLVKGWNYLSNAGIRSPYLELRVAEQVARHKGLSIPNHLAHLFTRLLQLDLDAMDDPMQLGDRLFPCSARKKDAALSMLNVAAVYACRAVRENDRGDTRCAHNWWNKLFAINIPRRSGFGRAKLNCQTQSFSQMKRFVPTELHNHSLSTAHKMTVE